MQKPTIRQVEALLAVVESGTVSKASTILGISQPATSKLIQELELETGMRLFEREGGRLIPTGRGRRLYEEAQRIFGGIHQLNKAIDSINKGDGGYISVGVLPSLSGPFLARVLQKFREGYPQVFVSVETRTSQALLDSVLERRLDAALIIGSLGHSSLVSQIIKGPPAVAVLPLGHSLCRKRTIMPADLAKFPFIAFESSVITRRLVDAAFETFGLRPNIVIEASTAPNIAEFVAAGLGVTVADPLTMEFASDRVVTRPFKPDVMIENQVIRPARGRNTDLVKDFVREVHATARSSPMVHRPK